MLSVILPAPFDTMPDRDITIAFRDENAVKLAISSLKKRPESDWSRWRLTGTTHPYWHKFAGQKYHNLPGDRIMAVIDQLKFDATTATIGAAGMSENNLLRIITDPLCMPGSDGNAVRGKTPSGTPHPRAFGAIAKFFRMKLDAGETIGNVVASATSKPADFFNLPDIGTLHCGKKADITVFSPEEINSDADFTDPYRPAAGIRLSMLDGKLRFF